MKKYGKYEKQSETAVQKQPKTKNVLLQTYFTSLLCMVLCVTMFLGTSYAWFTSEVENKNNEIYIGTLDVGLYKQTVGQTDSLVDLSTTDAKLFDGNIRWEPGYTAMETVVVKNEGDLAFLYELTFTEGMIYGQNSLEALQNVAKNFTVYVHAGAFTENDPKPGSFKEIYDNAQLEEDKRTWEPVRVGGKVATLADILTKGIPVITDSMSDVRTGTPDETASLPGPNDSKPTEDTYVIALHMNEEVQDPKIMGQKIGLNVKLVAYQMGYENDSFGSKYDQMAATAEGLSQALQNGGAVMLVSDIELGDTKLTVPEGVTSILDLNGHKITGTSDETKELITNNGTLTINGSGEIAMTFAGTVDNGKAVNAISNRGTLIVNGGKISNICKTTNEVNQIGYAIDNYNGSTLTVNGGEITASGSSYYDGIRLFCGSNETVVTVNGGTISTIWAQNPSNNKATEVNGTVIVNGGEITTVYYENYTTVKIKNGLSIQVDAYGAGKENTANAEAEGYTVYSFVQSEQEQ